MVKCNNCKKKFISQYLLDKHLNREIPCDQEIKCEKCKKTFDLKRDLIRHMNRKTSCIKSDNIKNKNILLELEKEKTKQEEEKTRREIEKEKEKTRREIEKLKLKEEIEIKKIELQRQKNLEIEEVKTKRKEKTTHIINNIETINIQNNFIQQISSNYVNDDVLCLETKLFNKTKNDIYKRKIHRENDFNIYLFNNSKTIRDFICMFLKRIFNNEKFLTMKCLFYNKELDKFYGIFQNPETKEIRQIDYEKYIDVLFRPMLIELFKNMKQYCEEHKKNINPNDKGYDKYIDITSGRLTTLDSLENVSKDALYDGYMISKEEYDQIIIGYNEEILVC